MGDIKQVGGKTFEYVRLEIYENGAMFLRDKDGDIISMYNPDKEKWLADTNVFNMLNDGEMLEVLKVTSMYPQETQP